MMIRAYEQRIQLAIHTRDIFTKQSSRKTLEKKKQKSIFEDSELVE